MTRGKAILITILTAFLSIHATNLEAGHRDAPIVALDQKANVTDFFAFVSYDDPTKVTFIMTVDPFLEPGNGPNYFPFDPGVQYSINIDNNNDASSDITFQFRFTTEIRTPDSVLGFLGAGAGINAPANSPPPVAPGRQSFHPR